MSNLKILLNPPVLCSVSHHARDTKSIQVLVKDEVVEECATCSCAYYSSPLKRISNNIGQPGGIDAQRNKQGTGKPHIILTNLVPKTLL